MIKFTFTGFTIQ